MLKLSMLAGVVPALVLFACDSPPAQIPVRQEAQAPAAVAQPVALLVDSTVVPGPRPGLGRVLQLGIIHYGEVPPNAGQQPWYGLFQGKNGYYLARTRLHLGRTEDPVGDNMDDAWEVTPRPQTDLCLVVLGGVGTLPTGPVDSAAVSRAPIYPRQPQPLTWRGRKYILVAEADQLPSDTTEFGIRNYKLFLRSAEPSGGRQLLVAAPELRENVPSVVWAGDLDHDQRPDFILQTSCLYNEQSFSIYLSSKAERGELVGYVGTHRVTGC